MVVFENNGFAEWREGCGTIRASGGDVGGGSEMLCVGRPRQWNGGVSPTLTGDHENRVTDYTAICVGNGQLHNMSMSEICNNLDCMHDQQAVLIGDKKIRKYIVRRLIPLECGRLQGFPDGWADLVDVIDLSDEDIDFWESIRKMHAEINGKKYKPFKSKDSLIKWLNGLHTDSAEYKMWGNGIALPCASFVVGGVADALREELSNAENRVN